jgi:AcrR family transcriptional regulator
LASDAQGGAKRTISRRLSGIERRRQLLETALLIVRDEGADRLTLGHLAERADVSKPVAYDHFGTRSRLLIELYRWIDTERVKTFREAMTTGKRSLGETADLLAAAYIRCAAETTGEFQKVGAALAGSEEKAAVFEELLANCVQMFISVLGPHSRLPPAELEQRCVGLVGAGEALAGALMRGSCSEAEAIRALTGLVRGGLRGS